MCAAQKDKKGVTTLERQREIERLEKDVEDLRRLASTEDGELELERLKREVLELRREFYTHLGPWQRAQIARHPQRPYTLDYTAAICSEFNELHGDRMFGDDLAIVGGLARLDERSLGALLMHFMLETIAAAELMGVNAFDQPAVEEGKVLARQYLSEMR